MINEISVIYFCIGNIVGYEIYSGIIEDRSLLSYLFFPYNFTWGLSSLAGVDGLTFIFIVIAFLILLAVFYPIGLLFEKQKKEN